MVINRRGALLSLVIAAFGRAGFGFAHKGTVGARVAQANSVPSDTQALNAAEGRLQQDLERLSGRVYSEEGIPMVLACENLVPSQTTSTAFVPTALNRNLSSAFRRDTNTFEHMKPDASAADIAKIIEMLADRDFSAGGLEKTL